MQDNLARRIEASRKIRIEGERILVDAEGAPLALPSIPLPMKFVEWIEQGRKSMYAKLQGKASPGFFTSHLPVMVTQSEGPAFAFNCSNKGVGYLPKAQYLGEFAALFRETIERTKGRPWQESLEERINAVSRFYFDREKIDYRALSSLEIFEKTTFNNLTRHPFAALHYTGNGPDYVSFQVNCAVEIIGPQDPRHEFVKLARVMFEYDSFHIAQHRFPYAYVFWISEVADKTPFRVPEKGNKIVTLPAKGSMKWSQDAIESINRAPGMIRQFITEGIEKYARERGFEAIDMNLVREAREVLERTPPSRPEKEKRGGPGGAGKYARIYVGLDSSGPSNEAMALALQLGKATGAEMIGSHVYAAKMHDNRFRAMEGGLPEEFQKEKELNRQRKIHDSLITKGLELITDSYLEVMEKACKENGLRFTANSLEGKNWKAMAEDIQSHDYDLVVLGAHGIGRVGNSQLGTVAERLLRRVRRDVMLCRVKAAENVSDTIVVCLDGSTRSWGGLERALDLAKTHGKKVVAVSAFDPYFHYAMFKSLNKTLTEKARKVFKFEEQEKLHEDIIDSGLAKIYQSYLNIAKRLAAEAGVEIETHLLDGKPFEKILQFVRKSPPWLLVMGRIGFHSDEDMDIGGNTENLCRLAPCNILVTDFQAKPPVEFQAEETVAWTKEALAKMERIPAMAQGMAKKAIQNYCVAEGYTVVTESILNAAIKTLLPPEALARMGIVTEAENAKGESHDKIALSFKCQACGHVHHGSRPQVCPICGVAGHLFKLLESAMVQDGQVLEALGDRQLIWEKPALAELEAIDDAVVRDQVRNKLEKRALSQRIASVTLEMLRAELGSPAPSAARAARMPDPPSHPVWTEAALQRLERVPEGFMRNAAKNMVEEHAKAAGLSEISLEAAEAGLGKAREKMHAAMVPGHAPVPPHGTEKASASASPHASATASSDPAAAQATPGAWECHLCGFVVDGARPGKCPNCGTGHFTAMGEEQRAKAHPSAFRALEWDADAQARLERVPQGFMRDMTRMRVEKWARSGGADKVTLEIMDGKYGGWAEGGAGIAPELEWSEEAAARAERIPDFIRPMVKKEIERRVKAKGGVRVEAADMDQAMNHWSGSGSFHGRG
jgi:nucleotide-binding universal stress UspA family protein